MTRADVAVPERTSLCEARAAKILSLSAGAASSVAEDRHDDPHHGEQDSVEQGRGRALGCGNSSGAMTSDLTTATRVICRRPLGAAPEMVRDLRPALLETCSMRSCTVG